LSDAPQAVPQAEEAPVLSFQPNKFESAIFIPPCFSEGKMRLPKQEQRNFPPCFSEGKMRLLKQEQRNFPPCFLRGFPLCNSYFTSFLVIWKYAPFY